MPVIDAIRKIKSVGGTIILWTCRENDALNKAVDWCKENNVPFDHVNENVPQEVIKYNNDSRKVSADFYVDDKSITLD